MAHFSLTGSGALLGSQRHSATALSRYGLPSTRGCDLNAVERACADMPATTLKTCTVRGHISYASSLGCSPERFQGLDRSQRTPHAVVDQCAGRSPPR